MTFRGFGRLAVMLAAAAVFCALPTVAVANGQGPSDDDVSGGGNVVGGGDQGANTGDNDAIGGTGDGGGGGDALSRNDTGNAINQQQNAQNNCTIVGGGNECNQSITQNQGVGGGAAGAVVSARGVRLAQTGFDAWILAVLGGLALAGGVGMLAAQRRGTKLFKGSR